MKEAISGYWEDYSICNLPNILLPRSYTFRRCQIGSGVWHGGVEMASLAVDELGECLSQRKKRWICSVSHEDGEEEESSFLCILKMSGSGRRSGKFDTVLSVICPRRKKLWMTRSYSMYCTVVDEAKRHPATLTKTDINNQLINNF